ncbi:hypothetical protein [Methylomicrobium sp. Wu6]|uniref:hypothetical protein n=1 Tax=Methylomicrobium sp. Wu6 TaxID=3107928 RepID=UPI002DD69D79|nr:hypothetical protein [Methylomicrobium sp. Wu6]MEC4750517.1 hypothetical protein [Methylomicrobium sp. Wu6]
MRSSLIALRTSSVSSTDTGMGARNRIVSRTKNSLPEMPLYAGLFPVKIDDHPGIVAEGKILTALVTE